ncbi:cyclase family protein [Salinibaculum rarum]|uniref:cyclase family protein n=1 Tax=Salinibaculum rarum TaxID=3058903 RepID=UPI00265F2CC9|nr:cyclase family protein [Salinibaculum sp. KK48]
MSHYDCSQLIEPWMSVYPGSRPVNVETATTVESAGSRVTELDLDTHVGTHIDAPAHTLEDGKALDDFPVSAFAFDARLVDCTGLADREPLGPEMLGEPSDHDMLVVRTGWDDHWGTERYRDHPYLTEAAAAWCAEHGYSLGLDTFGPDPTPSVDADRERPTEPDGLAAHDALFADGQFIVENLRGLERLPAEFELTAYPLALAAEASPVRAVAHT